MSSVSLNDTQQASSAGAVLSAGAENQTKRDICILKLAVNLFRTNAFARTPMAGGNTIFSQLRSVIQLPASSPNDATYDPQARLGQLGVKVKEIQALRQMLSLIVAERNYLEISFQEATLGMTNCEYIETMGKSGIKAWNDGSRWQFNNLFNMPESPEGFAFFWPLVYQYAAFTTSTDLKVEGLNVRFDWSQDTTPMRSFLEQSINHTSEEVRRLAQGHLAMFHFNRETKVHATYHKLHYIPLMLRLIALSDLLSDDQVLSLLPICAPIFFRLLLVEVFDLIKTNQDRHVDHDEFPREIYEAKTYWHARAQRGYLERQNTLFELLIQKLPKKTKFQESVIYKVAELSQVELKSLAAAISIPSPQELAKRNPYVNVRDNVASTAAEHTKKTEPVEKGVATSVEPEQKQRVAASTTSPTSSWTGNRQPFDYQPRVLRWFNMPSTDDAKLEKTRILHAFHKIVDKLVLEKSYTFQRMEKRGHSYYLVAQFNSRDGTFQRGVVGYGTFKSASGEKCYHRHLSRKTDDEFVRQELEKVFTLIDQDEDYLKGDNLESLSTTVDDDNVDQTFTNEVNENKNELPRIESDPHLGLIKIHDEKNGLVISLFRLPQTSFGK